MSYLFTKRFIDQLYVGPAGSGEFYLVLSAPDQSPPDEIELAVALANARATFVYCATPAGITAATAQDFVKAILKLLTQSVGADRGFVWLRDPQQITVLNAAVMGLASNGKSVQNSLKGATIVNGLSMVITNGTSIELIDTTLKLDGTIRFEGPSAPTMRAVSKGTIPFAGRTRGNVEFVASLEATSLLETFRWGFQFFYSAKAPDAYISEWLPLADVRSSDFPQFYMSLNPSDPSNEVIPDLSTMTFTGETLRGVGRVPTILDSYYRTAFGEAIALVPSPGPFDADRPNAARLQFNGGPIITPSQELFHVSPCGDFTLQIGDGTDGATRDLMCGLQGTEFITFRPKKTASYAGDRMRFAASKQAYAPLYPFQAICPTGPQINPLAPLLEPNFVTSWANIIAGDDGKIPYVAQPKGLTLYGRDRVINPPHPSLLGMMDPSVILPAASRAASFPLVPYAGVRATKDVANVPDFELQVIGPTRRRLIGEKSPGNGSSRRAVMTAANEAPYNTTTPTGFLVTVDGGGWTKILLGQNLEPSKRQLYFCRPLAQLQQAFQTNQLFAVIANAKYLGKLAGSGSGACGTSAAFYNEMNIGDWLIRADVGENRYNDYRSVVIIKGKKGPLYDIVEGKKESPCDIASEGTAVGLILNPDQWTQRNELGAPSDYPPGSTTLGDPDPQELPVLSAWLQDYFEAARIHPETKYFRKFNEIAKNPNWTGVLILRAPITVPKQLAGIVAGVRDRNAFVAHHFGIEITPVMNNPENPIDLDGSSSMFGLIYYQDPAFVMTADPEAKPEPVPPPAGVDYEFRLLTLKVLFENTSITEFHSWSQLTINKLFDSPVKTIAGGSNNTIILRGTYQENGGEGLYNLGIADPVRCYLSDNNIINKIEITAAQMTTQSANSSRFALTGFIDFAVILDRDNKPFDVFSFGSDFDEQSQTMRDELRKGLAFAALSVDMVFAADPVQNKYLFNASNIRFDLLSSTPRAHSIFINFALGLQRLITGDKDTTPNSSGFAPLITDATLTGVESGTWYGLEYQLNMGTPGNLAGGVGLTSGLLTAWSPKSGPDNYAALVGLRLPGTGGGAKLISLQTVLKLSIGQMVLTFDRRTNSFLLMLTEIALRFLGLLKIPPSGSSTFFLFGNPKSEGKPSGLGWYAMYNQLEPKPPQIEGVKE